MTHDPTFWLLARASGLTAYLLLTLSVLAGLVVKSKPFGRALKASAVTDVHRFFALLGLGMLVLHGVALVLDSTVHMPVAALFVPYLSSYRPTAVAFGVLAAELAALITVSFSLRRWIGGHRPRAHRGNRLRAAVGVQPLPRGGGRRRLRHGLACARPPHSHSHHNRNGSRKERMMYRIVIDGSLCSGFGDCADLAPDVFELDSHGKVNLRVGTSNDERVLEAADACPMGAIRVEEVQAA